MEDVAQAVFEKGAPWLGVSSFDAKEIVKNAGGRWDKQSEKWKAVDEIALISLIETRAWLPVGCDVKIANALVLCL